MFALIKKYKVAIIVVLVVAVLAVIAIRATAKGDYTTTTPTIGDLVRTVKVSGKVVPQSEVSLGFENAGTVARVYRDVGDEVSRGDILVKLDDSKVLADLTKARADLASARAELAKIDGAGIYSTKTDNAKRAVIQAIADAYTQADDAIHNKADQVFENPRSQNPKIIFAFDDVALRDSIDANRLLIEEALTSWKVLVSKESVSTYSDSDLESAKSYASSISRFLDDVARAVNDFTASGALSQTSIDKYRTDISVGRQNVNTAASALISKGDALRESLSDVPVQAAKVEAARATVIAYESDLSKTALVSPIAGVVSKQDAKTGQAVSLGTPLASVISQSYKIETYVPEVSIAGVSVKNPASVTLDAYGTKELFKAVVSAIDPAETIRDGVSTYKVTLTFVSPDARIRSGMTSTIDIETQRKANVLLIPERSVVSDLSGTSVYVLIGDKASEKRGVAIGERDSSGNVEVLSGITSAEAILINPPKK